jgi:hypothetical protein
MSYLACSNALPDFPYNKSVLNIMTPEVPQCLGLQFPFSSSSVYEMAAESQAVLNVFTELDFQNA